MPYQRPLRLPSVMASILAATGRRQLHRPHNSARAGPGCHHPALSISVADRTWLLPRVLRPFPSPHFEIVFPSRNQARQLQRMLVPAG
jgi:hypothetical protein